LSFCSVVVLERICHAGNTVANASLRNIEVCYTIQKGNIQQLDSDVDRMSKELPGDVSVRLKIVHGPENGKNFLLSKEDLKTLRRVLRKISANRRFNAKYLLFMMDNYFKDDDLCNGTPLKGKMDHEFRRENYLCFAIRLSCLINANGDMYPCCFLFDDNHADSQIRKHSKIAVNVKQYEAFLDAWYSNPKLNALRQTQLPVNTDACYYCTRYFFQNELLNEVYKKFSDYKRYGLAESFMEKCSIENGIDTPYWL
jgi:MoaA/NifB/PqqE/SkfB family radical SAM enzyme